MGLRLNRIKDDVVRENLEYDRERLRKFLTADATSALRQNPVRYAERLADAASNLALGLYQQQGSASEIRDNFALAARELLGLLFSSTEASLSPLEFEKAIALGFCFSPDLCDERLTSFPKERFLKNPKSLAFYARLATYLDILRRFLVDRGLDEAACEALESECRSPGASNYDAVTTLSKVVALRAIAARSFEVFNRAVGILVDAHAAHAATGETQDSPLAFICLPALMLAQLGKTYSVRCSIESPYLPLQLLEV